MDRLTVPEAAQRLGVTRDAVYKRVQRDQIAWDKDSEGRVYVYVDTADIGEDSSVDDVHNAHEVLVETLREEVES